MSRGGYTAAIDMWSLGCIFGELLQRIAHLGSAATPNLQVREGIGGVLARPLWLHLGELMRLGELLQRISHVGSAAKPILQARGCCFAQAAAHTGTAGGPAVCHPRPAQDARGWGELPGRPRQRDDPLRAAGWFALRGFWVLPAAWCLRMGRASWAAPAMR